VTIESTQLLIPCSEISPEVYIDKIDVTFKHYQIIVTQDQNTLKTANNHKK
jgi:hypothetical protein